MRWMDRYRRLAGLGWVAVGLGFQAAWWSLRHVVPGPVTLVLCGAVVLLAVLVLVQSPRGTWLAGWLVAVLLGLDFGGAVADRFGAFGAKGTAGVSWGTWSAFVDYTSTLLPAVDRVAVTAAAATATGAEIGLSVLLIIGWQRAMGREGRGRAPHGLPFGDVCQSRRRRCCSVRGPLADWRRVAGLQLSVDPCARPPQSQQGPW